MPGIELETVREPLGNHDYAIHALEEFRYLSTVRGAGLRKSPVLYL